MTEEIKTSEVPDTEKKINHRSTKFLISIAMSSHAITDLYASFIIGIIPVLAIKFNLSLFLVSLLTSVTGIANSLTQPVFGYFADRYNTRYFLAAGPFFSAIFISLLPVMPNYYLVLAMLFLGNLSIAAMHPPSAAMGGKFGGKTKGLSNSLISFSGTFGYSIGSFFIIIVIEKLGAGFSPITMLPGIIMAIIVYKFVNIPPEIRVSKNTKSFFQKIRTMDKIKLLKLSLIFLASYARDITWIVLITFIPL
ncbi:MAG: MFS transporter, partial [Actinobacteria bacterium]|nr:MFS transporter [Actinomycetota bacterium]